jgi:hypothetical protein
VGESGVLEWTSLPSRNNRSFYARFGDAEMVSGTSQTFCKWHDEVIKPALHVLMLEVKPASSL